MASAAPGFDIKRESRRGYHADASSLHASELHGVPDSSPIQAPIGKQKLANSSHSEQQQTSDSKGDCNGAESRESTHGPKGRDSHEQRSTGPAEMHQPSLHRRFGIEIWRPAGDPEAIRGAVQIHRSRNQGNRQS